MDERFEDQREQFERALARLHEVLRENETAIVRDALIQRFEFTFEMAWRCLHRYLVAKGERVAQQAWAVLPLAFQSQLIDDAEVWDGCASAATSPTTPTRRHWRCRWRPSCEARA